MFEYFAEFVTENPGIDLVTPTQC